MSFLYPRTITLWRLPTESQPGAQGYIGETGQNLTQVGNASCAAAIQQKKDSGSQPAHLPGDISKRVYWELLTAPGTQVLTFQSNDEVRDDLNNKYHVVSAYLTSLGNWQCLCERKEA